MQSIDLDDFMREHEKQEPYTATTRERLVSVEKYAKMTGLTPAAIRQRLQKGRLAGVKFGSAWNVKIQDDGSMEKDIELEKLRTENKYLREKMELIKQMVSV